MKFDSNKPIYLQIADGICERILSGELKGAERIPSVREWGSRIGVNPNTVVRSYDILMESGIIYNQRGIGFFVCEDAAQKIREKERGTFIKEELPAFIRRAELLEINIKQLI